MMSRGRAPHAGWLAAATVGLALQIAWAGSPSSGALYLHGSGGTAKPHNLFLDTIAPGSGTAKYQDSAAIGSKDANRWREIGGWISDSTELLAPAGPTSVASVDLWIGLKTEGVNAAYDLRAVVSQNDSVVAEGQALCISGRGRRRERLPTSRRL